MKIKNLKNRAFTLVETVIGLTVILLVTFMATTTIIVAKNNAVSQNEQVFFIKEVESLKSCFLSFDNSTEDTFITSEMFLFYFGENSIVYYDEEQNAYTLYYNSSFLPLQEGDLTEDGVFTLVFFLTDNGQTATLFAQSFKGEELVFEMAESFEKGVW